MDVLKNVSIMFLMFAMFTVFTIVTIRSRHFQNIVFIFLRGGGGVGFFVFFICLIHNVRYLVHFF